MNNVINWFEIPVVDMDRAVAFYEPVMQVTLRRETMDCAELAVFPHQDPAPGGALAKFEGPGHRSQAQKPNRQGASFFLPRVLSRIFAAMPAAFPPFAAPEKIPSMPVFQSWRRNRLLHHARHLHKTYNFLQQRQ